MYRWQQAFLRLKRGGTHSIAAKTVYGFNI